MKIVDKRLVTCSMRATPEMRARLEELGAIHTRNLSAQLEHMVKIADLVIGLMETQELPRIEGDLRKLLGKNPAPPVLRGASVTTEAAPLRRPTYRGPSKVASR